MRRQLLSPLPAGRPPAAHDRYGHESHRVSLRRRLILVDKQGITGRKTEYHSVLYKSITHFSVETAGSFDLDAELKIWISGNPMPIQKQFSKGVNIYEVQAMLTHFVAS
ncbi:PH domain-containing protein [Rhodococcus sp. PAM 2766]|uniref:PH domain-containing protein n=1 Tax=Rhodococcus parequi TaxID=3137122 RepID=A0ABW9FIE0_9NOCA